MPKKLIWHTERRIVKDLVPYEKNPRILSLKQQNDLVKSFKKFNMVELIAINLDGRIVAGNQRVKILTLLGRYGEEIDVRVPNRMLSEEEYKEYLLRSNANTADWDYELLQSFDPGLLLEVGFDDANLNAIWDDQLDTEDDDFKTEEEIKKIGKPKSKLGELYKIGDYCTVLCGDSTLPENVEKLAGGNKMDLVFPDIIYNINYNYEKGQSGKSKYGGTVDDNKSYEEYKNFTRKAMANALAVSKKDSHHFWWCDESYIGLFQELYRELGLNSKRVCHWLKDNQSPTPNNAFNKVTESCVYAVRGNPYLSKSVKNLNEIMNKEIGTGNRLIDDVMDLFNIWLVKRLPASQYSHPTQKPVTLYDKALRRCTKVNDNVLDLFGGSGSLAVACVQMKRHIYIAEIEPIFIDLIIKRIETLTGEKAKLINK
jgi:DNA modification methylase